MLFNNYDDWGPDLLGNIKGETEGVVFVKADFETRLSERELREAEFIEINEHRSNFPFVQDWPKAAFTAGW